jgi:SAM-dependent methyltransferase
MKNQHIDQHNIEIQKNLKSWENKPLLKLVYQEFYRQIHQCVNYTIDGQIVELGSGIGNIKTEIPKAICTDIFENPWIDRVENAYQLSFQSNSLSNLILFDVFHHIEYPGNALAEFHRVLKPEGRVIIFDPSMGMTGLFVYGIFHHEPVALLKKINWIAPKDFDPWKSSYYAAQGNAGRIFSGRKYRNNLNQWQIIKKQRFSALSYILSGGYSKPSLLGIRQHHIIKGIEKTLDRFPRIFSTRLLIVLQKKAAD